MTAAQATTIAPIDAASTKLRRLKQLGRDVIRARRSIDAANATITEHRPDIDKLAAELGLTVVECVPGEGIQIVRPVGRSIDDSDKVIAAIAKHRPELLDLLAPATRKVDMSALSKAIESGAVPKTWRKHIVETAGTVQIKHVGVK